jgi:hypothetical protein
VCFENAFTDEAVHAQNSNTSNFLWQASAIIALNWGLELGAVGFSAKLVIFVLADDSPALVRAELPEVL